MAISQRQLISYIATGAPVTRRPAFGEESDLRRARGAFPQARRAIMYIPMEFADKSLKVIRSDVERIAGDYGPCDIVAADIEAGTPDERILEFLALCEELSQG